MHIIEMISHKSTANKSMSHHIQIFRTLTPKHFTVIRWDLGDFFNPSKGGGGAAPFSRCPSVIQYLFGFSFFYTLSIYSFSSEHRRALALVTLIASCAARSIMSLRFLLDTP